MKVLMLATRQSTPDGFVLCLREKNAIYDLGDWEARTLIQNEYAKEVENDDD